MSKKETKRSKTKYPGLEKKVNLPIRHELIDFDYIDKLDDKEKQWLSNFMTEYAAADFRHPGKKINKTKKSIKAIYNANNARNRDTFAITKAKGMLKSLKGLNGVVNSNGGDISKTHGGNSLVETGFNGSRSTVPNELEDTLIQVLDHHYENKSKKSILK